MPVHRTLNGVRKLRLRLGGRPRVDQKIEAAIRKAITKGDKGKHKIAAELGVGSGTVARIKAEMLLGDRQPPPPRPR